MGSPGVLDTSLELAPYRKAGSYWLREVRQSVIGGHWRSLIRLIRFIRLISLIRLDLQMRGRLHSFMLMDGMGLGWMDEMVIGRGLSESTFGAHNINVDKEDKRKKKTKKR